MNYSLVVNSSFKPFSYQEMLAPVLMATQAHQELENQYGELATKASVWEEMANEQTDPNAYKMYKTYADDLEKQAGQLAREGLNATSRRNMLNMRARYSKEITPIEQAYKTRQRQAEQQQQALLQNPTLMLSRRAAATSLDKYIENPNLDYESYSGALLTQQVGQAAAAIAKELRNYGKGKPLDGFTRTWLQQHGYTAGEVALAINNPNDPKSSSVLNTIVNNVIADSGISKWADDKTLNQAYSYARQGLWQAVGQTQVGSYTDQAAVMRAQEAMQRRAENRAAARKAEELNRARLNNLAINPLNIYSSRELSKDEKKYKEDMKSYSKYFYKENGQWKMTYDGWREYNRNATPRVSASTSGGSTARLMNAETQMQNKRNKFTPTSFRTFMDSIGAKNVKGWQPGNLGNVWGRYITDSPAARTSKYDATRVTEYDYPIAGDQQGDMKDAIMTAGRGLSIKEVDYDSKSKKFKDTGEEISMEDLKSDKYKVTATRFSLYGATVMIQDDKGNVRRFRMPAGINTTNEQNRDRAMAAANQWQQVVNTGQYTDARGNVHQATPDEITYAQQQYTQAIQQAYLFHSQLGVQNKTKEQEFNPYGY